MVGNHGANIGFAQTLKSAMARRRNLVALTLLLLAALLALAWYDGGREEQRMIVQPVDLTEQGA